MEVALRSYPNEISTLKHYIETLHYRLQIALKNDIMVKLYSPDKMVGIQH